jgi:hypothetical protein
VPIQKLGVGGASLVDRTAKVFLTEGHVGEVAALRQRWLTFGSQLFRD